MKTLVTGNAVWLADHLGCTLLNTQSGKGIVTQVDHYDDVWDAVVCSSPDDGGPSNTKQYGKSAFAEKIYKSQSYAMTVAEGQGMKLAGDVDGFNVGIVGWWEDGKWVGKRAVVFGQYGLMNRDLGPLLGSPQGVAVTAIDGDCRLVEKSLDKWSDILGSYNGPVCMALIVTGKDVYLSGVCLGFLDGWIETLLELQIGNLLDNPFNLSDNVAVGIQITVPPYPYGKPECFEFTVNDQAVKHVRFLDTVKRNGKYQPSGISGRLFYATAWGRAENIPSPFKSARLRVYRSLRGMTIPDIQYRTDISTVADKDLEQLRVLGWI